MRFNPNKVKRRLVKKLNKDRKVRDTLVYTAIRETCVATKELKQHGINCV